LPEFDTGGPSGMGDGGSMAATLRGYSPDYVRLADDPVAYYVTLAAQDSGPGQARPSLPFKVHNVGSRGDGPDDKDTTRVDEVIRRSLERGAATSARSGRRGGWSQGTVPYEPLSPAARRAAQLGEHGR
jgi:hypothetical protein